MSTTTDIILQSRPPDLHEIEPMKEHPVTKGSNMGRKADSNSPGLESPPGPKRQKLESMGTQSLGLPIRNDLPKANDTHCMSADVKAYEKFVNTMGQAKGCLRKLEKDIPAFLHWPDLEEKLGLSDLETIIASIRNHIHPPANGAIDLVEVVNESTFPTADMVFVDQVEHLFSLIGSITEAAQEHPLEPCCYIDCEGTNLGRNGTVTILSVYIPQSSKVYIVDLLCLGDSAFASAPNDRRTLKDLLGDSTIIKGMFDCRGDSDALFAHHELQLSGIIDIQLMDVVTRKPTTANKIFGLGECIKQRLKHLSSAEKEKFKKLKGEGKEAMNSGAAFDERPLPQKLLEYAAQDVLVLPLLHDHYIKHEFYCGEWPARVTEESAKRVEQACEPHYDPKNMDMRKAPEAWVKMPRGARN